MSQIVIRPERAEDVAAIREVNIAAFADHPFSQQTEHLIVDALRAAGELTLSLVAVRDGRVVGHIAFSAARVGEATTGWYLLGPVAVLPGFQRQGIGSQLVRAGLETVRAAGAAGCVLVGDASFYGRFGFRTFLGLAYEGVPGEHVLALPFGDETPLGPISAHPAFEITAEKPVLPSLRTERLLMRPWRESDRDSFAELNTDPRMMEYLGGPLSRERADKLFNSIVSRFEEQGYGFWALDLEDGTPPIGLAGLNIPRFEAPFMPAVEIGWRLDPRYWGQGLASEAARAALDYAYDVLRLDEVVAFTAKHNARSQAVMTRLGMTRDPNGDFDHPMLAADSPLRRHVLYRLPLDQRRLWSAR